MITQLHQENISVNGHIFLKCWAILDDKKHFFRKQDYKSTQEIVRYFWDNRITTYLGGEIINLSFTSGKKDYSIINLIGVARDDALLRNVKQHLTLKNKDALIHVGGVEFLSEQPNHIRYSDLISQQRFFLTPKRKKSSSKNLLMDIALVSEKTLDRELEVEYLPADTLPDYLL